ncbi:MAG: hypothetical protein WD646_13355 [Actinomycetota bacterium]
MSRILRLLLVIGLALGSTSIGSAVLAQNNQTGDNSSETDQSGSATSGDAVGGQVVGVVSAGDSSVDATNRSEDVDIETGDTTGSNAVDNFTGQLSVDTIVAEVIDDGGEITGATGANIQDGDNTTDIVQAADATSGDGVGGQVIGVVTSAGGSADVVAANTSEDVDIETGDADADNFLEAFVGQLADNAVITQTIAGAGVISGDTAANLQTGDNELSSDQSATAASGDGVGGQVLGIVSAGDASVDATNSSTDVDIDTGDADADNDVFDAFVGQLSEGSSVIDQDPGDGEISGDTAHNLQDGDNSADLVQAADATSGDGVGGQVIGVVTSAGGSADVVAANTSEDVDIDTGDADADNDIVPFVGQLADNAVIVQVVAGEGVISGDTAANLQTGDNELDADQAATATTGDGVGGQVLGIVSAGEASVDATNSSTDVDIDTGDADADNFLDTFVGQLSEAAVIEQLIEGDAEITGDTAANIMDGDITSDVAQSANAVSGDAVAGQVAGVVTSAGGSADLVLANTSEDVDAESGESDFDNDSSEFVGQQIVGPDV